MATERADFPEDKYMHEIHRLKQQRDDLLAACKLVEKWWIEQGMDHFGGAPAAIFALRAAIAKVRGE